MKSKKAKFISQAIELRREFHNKKPIYLYSRIPLRKSFKRGIRVIQQKHVDNDSIPDIPICTTMISFQAYYHYPGYMPSNYSILANASLIESGKLYYFWTFIDQILTVTRASYYTWSPLPSMPSKYGLTHLTNYFSQLQYHLFSFL